MQSLLVSHTQRYHKLHRSGGHVWQGRFKSPVVQNDDHLLTVLRYIEANPLRAKRVEHAEDYRWSSYRAHGRGEADELLDRLALYEQLSPYAAVRQRLGAQKVHLPLEEHTLAAVRRSQRACPTVMTAWCNRWPRNWTWARLTPRLVASLYFALRGGHVVGPGIRCRSTS
jgi:hypothetical protein